MRLGTASVLVVDDDQDFSDALRRWIRQLGCECVVVHDAEAARTALFENHFDAALVDIQLPGLSGHALLAQLRRANHACPVIVMSGSADTEDVIRAWRASAADFLRKPFDFREFSDVLERAFATGAGLQAPPTPGPERVSVPLAGSLSPSKSALATPTASLPLTEATPAVQVEELTGSGSVQAAGNATLCNSGPAARVLKQLREHQIRLPALSTTLARLPDMLGSGDWSLRDVIDVVSEDSVVSAAILRAANTAANRSGPAVRDFKKACVQLGSHKLITVAFEVALLERFGASNKEIAAAMQASWKCSALASRIARELAKACGKTDPEEAATTTLFHNVGELLALSYLGEDSTEPFDLERLWQQVVTVHEDFGRALAASWGLPSVVIAVAGFHHVSTPMVPTSELDYLRLLALASWSVALNVREPYFPGEAPSVEPYLLSLGLTGESLASVLSQVGRS